VTVLNRCLIGSTGLVGSNLSSQLEFAEKYHSQNIESIRGKEFSEVICAGLSGWKWKVNLDPEADRARIQKLQECLAEVKTSRFVLISTIDVYGEPASGLDEDYDPSRDTTHAYGRHRQAMETWAKRQFKTCRIVRLPGIYGDNLKKNLIYDLIHSHCLEQIDPDAVFQWYSLERLARDLEICERNDLKVANLFPEPLSTRDLIAKFFADRYAIDPKTHRVYAVGSRPVSVAGPVTSIRYDLRTKYGALFGEEGHYVRGKAGVEADLKKFLFEG